MTVYYIPTPAQCDCCSTVFAPDTGTEMFDAPPSGRALERWGNICRPCFDASGGSLGIGRGQRYVRQPDGRFLLVEGGFDNTTSDNHDPLRNLK